MGVIRGDLAQLSAELKGLVETTDVVLQAQQVFQSRFMLRTRTPRPIVVVIAAPQTTYSTLK